MDDENITSTTEGEPVDNGDDSDSSLVDEDIVDYDPIIPDHPDVDYDEDAQEETPPETQIFTEQPVPPYNIGDIWRTNPDKVCITGKAAGESFAEADWVYAVEPDTPPHKVTRTVTVDEVVSDFSTASIEAYRQSGAKAIAVYSDDTEQEVSWDDVYDPASPAVVAANEADGIARATNQHFWHRTQNTDNLGAGAFVTDATQEEFIAASGNSWPVSQAVTDEFTGDGTTTVFYLNGTATDTNYTVTVDGVIASPTKTTQSITFGVAPADGAAILASYTKDTPWYNLLMNSLGLLLRKGLNRLASFSQSAISFFDGTGNEATNIVASFGSNGAQIGKNDGTHIVIDNDSVDIMNGSSVSASFQENAVYLAKNFDTLNYHMGEVSESFVDFMNGYGRIYQRAQGSQGLPSAGSPGDYFTIETKNRLASERTYLPMRFLGNPFIFGGGNTSVTIGSSPDGSSGGMWVMDSTGLPDIEDYDEPASAWGEGEYLAAFETNGIQLGKETGEHIRITSSGLELLNNTVSLASFGNTSARIGQTTTGNLVMSASSLVVNMDTVIDSIVGPSTHAVREVFRVGASSNKAFLTLGTRNGAIGNRSASIGMSNTAAKSNSLVVGLSNNLGADSSAGGGYDYGKLMVGIANSTTGNFNGGQIIAGQGCAASEAWVVIGDGDVELTTTSEGVVTASAVTKHNLLTVSNTITLETRSGWSVDTFYRAKKAGGSDVSMGVGIGGTNHGLYSHTQGRWLIHGDGTNVFLNNQNVSSVAANRVFASPSGSTGAASFRALVAADIPSISADKLTSGTLNTARLPKMFQFGAEVALNESSSAAVGANANSSKTLTPPSGYKLFGLYGVRTGTRTFHMTGWRTEGNAATVTATNEGTSAATMTAYVKPIWVLSNLY